MKKEIIEGNLEERWDFIMNYNDFGVYDGNHVFTQFADRHPNLDELDLIDRIQDGLDEIEEKHGSKPGYYAIISRETALKIPVEIRADRFDKTKNVVVLSTVLDKFKHPRNKNNEIEVFVEAAKKCGTKVLQNTKLLGELKRRSIGQEFTLYEDCDGFEIKFKNGEAIPSFEIIRVD